MATVNLRDAKKDLSQLVDRAAAGDEIIITKSGRPMARLVSLRRRTTPRPLGLLQGQVRLDDVFDAPLPDGMCRAFRGEMP